MVIADKLRNWVFKQVHVNNLVYNTCWEDPRCDRNLLQFDNNSEVVMITSAGCNALAYLLDDPKQIHCVDMNPRQNALLELKQTFFKYLDHQQLFQFFGQGASRNYEQTYAQIRGNLSSYSQAFWDKNIRFFSGKGPKKSFYHRGTSGTMAWLFLGYIKARKNLYNQLQHLLNADSLAEQQCLYLSIERKILNRLFEMVVNRHFTMCMLGVPRNQQALFVNDYDRGALGFIEQCLRHVFTQLSIKDNYFYRVYINGAYTQDCSPDYLQERHFDLLHERTDRIQTHTNTVANFLKENPGQYSHFILLDHQDWLADNNREALEEEWSLILENSRPGTKILLRSAAEEIDFFPDFVRQRVQFEDNQHTIEQHRLDRVGTYASVYVGIVN